MARVDFRIPEIRRARGLGFQHLLEARQRKKVSPAFPGTYARVLRLAARCHAKHRATPDQAVLICILAEPVLKAMEPAAIAETFGEPVAAIAAELNQVKETSTAPLSPAATSVEAALTHGISLAQHRSLSRCVTSVGTPRTLNPPEEIRAFFQVMNHFEGKTDPITREWWESVAHGRFPPAQRPLYEKRFPDAPHSGPCHFRL